MIKLLSPDEKRLAICLALIAGYVDAYGLIVYGVYVSFMSGNTTQTGSMIRQGRLLLAIPSALAILFFVTGSFAGTWLTHSTLRHSRQVLFAAIAALLAMIIGGTQVGNPALHAGVYIATLSLAMGLMNTTLSHIGAEPVNLTFVTGTLNKMENTGRLQAEGLSSNQDSNPSSPKLQSLTHLGSGPGLQIRY